MSQEHYKSKSSTSQDKLNKGVVFAMRPDLNIPEDPPEPDVAPTPSIPFSREAEGAVMGAVLINPDVFADLTAILKPSDFYIHKHSWIFTAFTKLAQRGDPIDYRTVCDELQRLGQLEEIGGPAYLTVLINSVETSLNAGAYARTVKDRSMRRGMISAANQIAQLAYDPKRPIEEVTAGALEAVHSQIDERENKRFVLRDAAFAMQPQPPIDYLVDGMLTSGSVNCFYGEAGSKKTYTALSLAVAVASGRQWLDFKTQRCPVLIVDEESGERRFSRRLNAAIRGELCQDEKLPLSFVSLAGFKMDEDSDPVLLQGLVKSTGARLVIIDALADVMSGDENDKHDVQPVFNSLRKIAESTEAAILLIHHAGKAGGYRGSSAIKGAVDLMVQITSENGSDFVNFKSEKNRDGEASTWAAKAVWTSDQFYLEPAARTMGEKLNPSDAHVIEYLKEHGPALLSEIKKAADSPNAARLAVYRLVDSGKILRVNPGEKGIKAKYAIH